MDEKGVYAIARSIWECDAFMKQKFTQREAWMWLIGAAVWKQTKINFDGRRVTLERGEFAFAIRFLAMKWKWSKTSVSRFIVALEKCSMIRDTKRGGVHVYSIIKYNEFQVVGLPSGTESGTQSGTTAGQQRDKEEAFKHLIVVVDNAPDKKPASKIPEWVDRDAWAGFVEMRQRIRKPMTSRAAQMIVHKLEQMANQGHDPTAVLDQSVRNSWQDVFPLKEQSNGQDGRRGRQTKNGDFLRGVLEGVDAASGGRSGAE